MLFPLALALSLAAPDPAPGLAADAVLGTDGGVCLATGYCTTPGQGGAPPGGPMYLALGLVATGITVLRAERRARPPEP
ncbi:MAG: hypothetical protein ACREOF_01140 [Gemmatimonadales bacterium]